MTPLALIVEPDAALASALCAVAERVGYRTASCESFQRAKSALLECRPDAVITNMRLAMFNGIHLVYLAKLTRAETCAIVFSPVDDPVLAREAQRAGAFHERQAWLPYSLSQYLTSALPPSDRRDVARIDRRHVFRGGRRSVDIEALRPAVA